MPDDQPKSPADPEAALRTFYQTSDAYLHDNLASHGEDYFKIYIDKVVRFVPAGSHILDFGCGTGFSSALLPRRGYRVTGSDLSPKFRDQKNASEKVDLVCADAKALPFPDASFAAVCSY